MSNLIYEPSDKNDYVFFGTEKPKTNFFSKIINKIYPSDCSNKKVKQFTVDDKKKRCHWIAKNSDKVYVQFHDECWGVPVYDDNQLFELLVMCGLLLDFNWTEILKRRHLLRKTFGGFDPNYVSKMGDEEITKISSNKELNLPENRVRGIVNNAKCMTKVASEHGSFSSYIWKFVSYKPLINVFSCPTNVPLTTPTAESMSKDMIKHGFRLIDPIIAYSFMQAAGMVIDHLDKCFRYKECVKLAERPWRHL